MGLIPFLCTDEEISGNIDFDIVFLPLKYRFIIPIVTKIEAISKEPPFFRKTKMHTETEKRKKENIIPDINL